MKTKLIIGVGNPLRSDDGVGVYVAGLIDAMGFSDIKTMVTQQLHVENIQDICSFEHIIIVDACLIGPGFQFYQAIEAKPQMPSSSHHLSINVLLTLAEKIYGKKLNISVCAIKGYNFEVGESLSSQTLAHAKEAIEYLCTKDILRSK